MTSNENKIHGSTNFIDAIKKTSDRKKSRSVLAIDPAYTDDPSSLLKDAKQLIEETSEFLCAVKLNLHMIIPLSLDELSELNKFITSHDLVSIADLKLNDIDNTNLVATRYLWRSGFSAVIVNPFVGYNGGLDLALREARSRDRGVIALVYMSHKGADEGFGLRLKDGRFVYELLIERAKKWGVEGVIVGATRPEIISKVRSSLPKEIKIFSPGHRIQGGDALNSLKAGSDYLIFGRSIVEAQNPRAIAKGINKSIVAWIERN